MLISILTILSLIFSASIFLKLFFISIDVFKEDNTKKDHIYN